ncbi:MAG TPA: ATP-grasp domain-containing protein [Thermoanaerobaculia bacterium]|nr:ATP-grasp domain-containing protein [Thermoanaerobaculia bacterium]
MTSVVFVAPFFLETTLRFVDAVARLGGVRTGLISQDPAEKLPPGLRRRLAAHRRVADGFDPRQIADAVRDLAREIGPPARLLGALEQLQVPLGEVRDALDIEGMRAREARNFRDKARMKDVLAAAGVPCARHTRVDSEAAARAFAERVGFPLVVKPAEGAGARGTYRVGDPEQLAEALAASRPGPERPTVIEEFVQGEEFSFDSVSVHGRPVWHSLSHYLPSPLEVVDTPWIQWCVLVPREVDDSRYDEIRRVAARALAALGMGTGLSHMEWFRRADGSILVSEVGARPPGAQITSLISWANDVDFYAAWAELVVFDRFVPPPRPFAAGCAYLRGQGRGRIRAVRGLDETLRRLGGLVVEHRPPALGAAASSSYEGDGYVIVRHPETAVVEKALHEVIDNVRVELA